MKKLILLSSLLMVCNTVFGMDKDQSEAMSIITTTSIQLSKPSQEAMFNLPEGKTTFDFELRYNPKTNISLIHHKQTITKRIRFDGADKEILSKILDPAWINGQTLLLSKQSRTFWINIFSQGTHTPYRIINIREVDHLDEATKEKEIKNILDDKHEQALASDRKWLVGIGMGVPVGMFILGLGSLYALLRIVKDFHFR